MPVRFAVVTGAVLALLSPPPSFAASWPRPTGAYSVGTAAFEVIDSKYPSDRPGDADGRRIGVRAWYPAAPAEGSRRPYFVGPEETAFAGAAVQAIGAFLPGIEATHRMAAVTTYSYENAPVARAGAPFPVLVFAHGGLGYGTQNTALMEELASRGYVVCSLGIPGGSVGVVYTSGDVEPFDPQWLAAVFSQPSTLSEAGVGERYRFRATMIDDGGLGPWAPRWRDDLLAVVDALQERDVPAAFQEVAAHSDPERVAYFGMSYGASAAVSAAQADSRAVAAVNLDGTHHLSDVFGRDVRIPLLVLTTETLGAFSNEFFFEPLESMGERDDILRIGLVNVSHLELTDMMFIAAAERRQLPGGGDVDGNRLHRALVDFMAAFFDQHLKDGRPVNVVELLDRHSIALRMDVSAVRAWAPKWAAPSGRTTRCGSTSGSRGIALSAMSARSNS